MAAYDRCLGGVHSISWAAMSNRDHYFIGDVMTCVICLNPLQLTWTFFHGEAVCIVCHAPYTVLHYENDVLVSKDPKCQVPPDEIPRFRDLWVKCGQDLEAFEPLARELDDELKRAKGLEVT